jgi:hypothetical protein
MMTLESIRGEWQRKGIVGHCPLCHRRDWEDRGEVALPSANGGEDVRASCGHCGTLLMVNINA